MNNKLSRRTLIKSIGLAATGSLSGSIYSLMASDLQDFFNLVFGKDESMTLRAEQMRSGIYKIGGILGASVVVLALLLLKFTS